MSTHWKFQEVSTYRRLAGKCPVCGKRVTRSRKFTHTVNPFNKNDQGKVRTLLEVRECVNAEAEQWVPDFTHAACAELLP